MDNPSSAAEWRRIAGDLPLKFLCSALGDDGLTCRAPAPYVRSAEWGLDDERATAGWSGEARCSQHVSSADVYPAVPLEPFLAIRRADGESIGDFTWMAVTDENDWSIAEAETDGNAFDEPTTWQIVRMVPELVAERTYPRSEQA